MHNVGGEAPEMPERYSIEKAKGGGFILEEMGKHGMVKYVYENVDDLLSDLRTDLGSDKDGDKAETKPESKGRSMARAMTDMEDEDEE